MIPTVLKPSRSMASRRQAALEAIRRHYREVGASPSHEEIGQRIGLEKQRIGKIVRDLAKTGVLSFTPGVARSIVLADEGANLSDAAIDLICLARGATVNWPKSLTVALVAAYPIEPDPAESVSDFGLPLLEALRDIE